MNTYETLTTEIIDQIAVVRLNRPQKLNAIDARMAAEIPRCIEAFTNDPAVLVVVLTGAGKRSFSVGGDMTNVSSLLDDSVRREEMEAFLSAVARYPRATVAYVNGYAFGGGGLLAAHCDIRICSESARFRFPAAAYGLITGSSHMAAILGSAIAKELLFTGAEIDAEAALRIGLVNRVVPDDSGFEDAMSVARMIAEASPAAISAAKQVIDTACAVEDAAKLEQQLSRSLRQSEEHKSRFREATRRVTGN